MREIFKQRPSSAMVVAVVALVAAVVGTAVAGPQVVKSVLNKKEKKQTRTIARNTVKRLAPGLSVASALTAANASNSAKVDGADVCSGTVNVLDDGSPQTLCSSGPLIVRGECAMSGSETTGKITLDTSQDGGWFVAQNISDAGTFTAVEDFLTVGGSEELTATDLTLSETSAEVESLSVTMGHPDAAGSSINGEFSVQANRTGTGVGTCLFSVGAVAG